MNRRSFFNVTMACAGLLGVAAVEVGSAEAMPLNPAVPSASEFGVAGTPGLNRGASVEKAAVIVVRRRRPFVRRVYRRRPVVRIFR